MRVRIRMRRAALSLLSVARFACVDPGATFSTLLCVSRTWGPGALDAPVLCPFSARQATQNVTAYSVNGPTPVSVRVVRSARPPSAAPCYAVQLAASPTGGIGASVDAPGLPFLGTADTGALADNSTVLATAASPPRFTGASWNCTYGACSLSVHDGIGGDTWYAGPQCAHEGCYVGWFLKRHTWFACQGSLAGCFNHPKAHTFTIADNPAVNDGYTTTSTSWSTGPTYYTKLCAWSRKTSDGCERGGPLGRHLDGAGGQEGPRAGRGGGARLVKLPGGLEARRRRRAGSRRRRRAGGQEEQRDVHLTPWRASYIQTPALSWTSEAVLN